MLSTTFRPTISYGLLDILSDSCALLALLIAGTSVATCLTYFGLPCGVINSITLQENGGLNTQRCREIYEKASRNPFSIHKSTLGSESEKCVGRGYPDAENITLGDPMTSLDAQNKASRNVKGSLDAIFMRGEILYFFCKIENEI